MSAERAEAIDPIGEIRQPKQVIGRTYRSLRIAERSTRDRLESLVDLTATLQKETELLARDNAFSEESARLHGLLNSEGIDLFEEVKLFETTLIKLALAQTGGHQARAAKLLSIKPSTLNTKIKLYGIELPTHSADSLA